MLIYFASVFVSSFQKGGNIYTHKLTDNERTMHDAYVTNVLESYHYIKRQGQTDKIRNTKATIFLDSGAYSAFTKGIDVSIEDYVNYIKRNEDILIKDDGVLCASVLDAIGDADKTYQNQKIMESLGVTPLPCYHYGEHPDVLEYYISNYPYVTIGGMVPISTQQLRIWLDWIWGKFLTDNNGRPRTKIHGFGLTTVDLMRKYPWYSVDSSAWLQFGNVGNLLWGERGVAVAFSEHSPSAKIRDRHFNTMPPLEQEVLLNTITGKGFDIKRLKENYYTRWIYNCRYFEEIRHSMLDKKLTFATQQPRLFHV